MQPLEWGELDNEWSERTDDLEKGREIGLEWSLRENGKTMVVWELNRESGKPEQILQVWS